MKKHLNKMKAIKLCDIWDPYFDCCFIGLLYDWQQSEQGSQIAMYHKV